MFAWVKDELCKEGSWHPSADLPLVPDEGEGGMNNHQREADRGSAIPVRYGQWLVFLVLLVLKGQCMRRESRKLSVTLKGIFCERNHK